MVLMISSALSKNSNKLTSPIHIDDQPNLLVRLAKVFSEYFHGGSMRQEQIVPNDIGFL
jgi:hypothetical protein